MEPHFPQSFHVSGNSLFQCGESSESLREDPRGIVWMWEEPKPWAKYIMGLDPSYGLTGWSRSSRHDADRKTDNSAIVIYRPDAVKVPLMKDGKQVIDPVTKQPAFFYRDLQVCEFAAPIDAVEIARVANVLGRVYAGEQGDQCECIFESFPGPGPLTTQEFYRLDYMNLWMWEYMADAVASATNSVGWHATPRSIQLLWTRSRRHLIERKAKILSPWLLDEYANAEMDMAKMAAKAAYGFHDDRLRASNLALWAGHKWDMNPERSEEPVTEGPLVDWQHRAPVFGEEWNHRESWASAVESWDE
jgi:hypothetical protein